MGYNTDFSGRFELNKPFDDETFEFLNKLASTRRMKRNLPPEYGEEGEFFVDGSGDSGQGKEDNILDYNRPPGMQPSLWLHWVPSDNRKGLEWDGGEKFYGYASWIKYLIDKVLAPKDYMLNGIVAFAGEGFEDYGNISITDNVVTVTYVDLFKLQQDSFVLDELRNDAELDDYNHTRVVLAQADYRPIWARLGMEIMVKDEERDLWLKDPEQALVKAWADKRVVPKGNCYFPDPKDIIFPDPDDVNVAYFGEGFEGLDFEA